MAPLPAPGLTLAPVSSLTRQPACHLPAGERDRAQPCRIRRCGALTGLDYVAATPADTALRAQPISKTLRIAEWACMLIASYGHRRGAERPVLVRSDKGWPRAARRLSCAGSARP